MQVIAPEWPGPQYPWWAALCALCPKRWQLPQDRSVYLRGGRGSDVSPQVVNMGLPSGLPGGVTELHAPTTPADSPPNVGPPASEAPRAADPGAQLMTAHRHTDTLPLGSRPGKVERKRDVQRFHPTGPPVSAPTTRSTAKPRHSSLGPPTSARRTLFHPRGAAQSSSDAPAEAGPPSEGPAPRDPLAIPMATDPDPVRGDMQGDTGEAPRAPPRGTDGNGPGTDTCGDAVGYTGLPAHRGGPHGD